MNEVISIYVEIYNSIIKDLNKDFDLDYEKFELVNFNTKIIYKMDQDLDVITSYYILIHLILSTFASVHNNIEKLIQIIESYGNNVINKDLVKIFVKLLLNDKFNSNSVLISCQGIKFKLLFKFLIKAHSTVNLIFKINQPVETLYKNLIKLQFFSLNETYENQINVRTSNKSMGKTYTPIPLVKFMIQHLNLVSEIEKSDPINFLDPGCGAGIFPIEILKMIYSNNKIKLKGKKISFDCIDLDFKSLITHSLLLLLVLSNSRKKNQINIEYNIIHANFLENNPKLNKKYNIIIGNPPYIGGKELKKEFRSFLGENFSTIIGKADLYFAFIEKSINLLKNGNLIFLIPRYWIESEFGSNLRKLLSNQTQIDFLIDFNDYKLFDKKGVHSSIIKIRDHKNSINQSRILVLKSKVLIKNLEVFLTEISAIILNQNKKSIKIKNFEIIESDLSKKWLIIPEKDEEIIKKLENNPNAQKLSKVTKINEGINTGSDKVSINHLKLFSGIIDPKINKYEGIFILTNEELNSLTLQQKDRIFIKKWIKGSDIDKWVISNKNYNNWIIYFIKDEILSSSLLIDHLLKFKPILENRAEIKRNKNRNWYELAWPRNSRIFENSENRPKLLLRYKSSSLIVAIDFDGYYTSADFRILNVKSEFNVLVLGAILNSDIVNYYLEHIAKKLGKIKEYYSYTLEKLPIVYPDEKIELLIEKLVLDIIKIKKINKNTDKLGKLEKKVNDIINTLYGISKEDLSHINNLK